MKNPLQNRISIEIEGNVDISVFDDFCESLEKKLKVNYDFYFKNYLKCCGYDINKKRIVIRYENMMESNILTTDATIKQNDFLIPTELLIQKYNLFDKKTIKTIKKACKVYDKYQTHVDPYEAIHVNFDARSFFPYIKEIYDRNFDLFDLNEIYRRKVDNDIISYSNKKNILIPKKDSIDLSNISSQGRVELRIFDSDKEGREKLIKFLKNTKRTVKRGYKDFGLVCYDSLDKINFLPGIKYPKTTNNILGAKEKFENVNDFIKGHKKGESFTVNEFLSMKFEEYDKIL